MSMINWADMQLAIMNALWEHGEATVHEVIAAIASERPPAYTTVLTVLTNLTKQGLVTNSSQAGSRMFLYRATVTREDIQQAITNELIDRLFDGNPLLLTKQLMETHSYEESARKELTELLCSDVEAEAE